MSPLTRPLPRRGHFEEPFWEFVARDELRLQCCRSCRRFRYPPGPACPECGDDGFGWEPITGSGRLLAWTTFHRPYFPEIPVPYLVGVAETEEGPLLIANLVGFGDVEPGLDMRVRLIYEDAASPAGGWRIYQWSPAYTAAVTSEETS